MTDPVPDCGMSWCENHDVHVAPVTGKGADEDHTGRCGDWLRCETCRNEWPVGPGADPDACACTCTESADEKWTHLTESDPL